MVKGDWEVVLYSTSLPEALEPSTFALHRLKPIPPNTSSKIQIVALMVNGLQTDQPTERALLSLQQHSHYKCCTGNLHPRQTRDSERWDLLLNKQKPIWGMCPTSVRVTKQAAGGGLGFVRLWGRQMGQGNLQLEQKPSPSHHWVKMLLPLSRGGNGKKKRFSR